MLKQPMCIIRYSAKKMQHFILTNPPYPQNQQISRKFIKKKSKKILNSLTQLPQTNSNYKSIRQFIIWIIMTKQTTTH